MKNTYLLGLIIMFLSNMSYGQEVTIENDTMTAEQKRYQEVRTEINKKMAELQKAIAE